MDKKKQKPYSDFEKQLLLQLVQSKMHIIENRKTDGVSQKVKNDTWEEIASQYNNSNVSQTADIKQLKKMWQNLKMKARDAKTVEAQRKRTGGGPAPPEIGPLESQVLGAMPNIIPAIAVPIDSNTLTAAGDGENDEESWLRKRARRDVSIEDISETDASHEPAIHVMLEPPAPIAETSSSSGRQFISGRQPSEKKSFEELKKDLIKQQLEHNKEKFNLELSQSKEKHELDMKFLKEKYELELEILKLKKQDLLK